MNKNKEKNEGGRSENTLLEYMRTQAWLAYLMEKTGAKTFGEIDGAILGNRPPRQSIDKMKDFLGDTSTIRGDKYGSNTQTPNESQINLIEKKPLGGGSKAVYEIGPMEAGRNIPLWATFEQNFNVMWDIVESYIPEMPEMRKRGAPYSARLERVIELFVPLQDWKNIDFKNPESRPSTHLIVDSWHKGYFQASIGLLAVAMAIYRLHLKANESMAQVHYLVSGLIAEPCKNELEKNNIYNLFVAAFNNLEIYDLVSRGEFEKAERLVPKVLNNTK